MIRWLTTIFIFVFCITMAVWATMSEIDDEFIASGTIKTSEEIIEIRANRSGLISVILFRDGSIVEQNQILLKYDLSEQLDQISVLKASISSLKIMNQRIWSEIRGTSPKYSDKQSKIVIELQERLIEANRTEWLSYLAVQDARIEILEKEINQINAVMGEIEKRIALESELLNSMKSLQQKGLTPKNELVQKEISIAELASLLISNTEMIAIKKAEIALINEEKENETKRRGAVKLSKIEENEMRILELNQRILAMDRSIQDENVKSAISGEVIEAFVSQQGEFVGQGQVIARVIPADSPFIVEAEVDPVFLGRIEIGMSAKITPASIDPSNDGHMTGIVQKIAKNSTTSNDGSVFYKVTIKLEEYSGDFTLTAGMVSEVSFVDKRTTVAEYLKSAIFR